MWRSLSLVQLSATPMDYTVHGILQARILEWVAFPFSRRSSQPRDWTQVSHIEGRFFTSWATREAQSNNMDLNYFTNFFLSVFSLFHLYFHLRCWLWDKSFSIIFKLIQLILEQHELGTAWIHMYQLMDFFFFSVDTYYSIAQASLGLSRKELAGNAGDKGLDPWVGKIPWRRERLPTPVFLHGESHGQRSPVGLSP